MLPPGVSATDPSIHEMASNHLMHPTVVPHSHAEDEEEEAHFTHFHESEQAQHSDEDDQVHSRSSVSCLSPAQESQQLPAGGADHSPSF